MRLTLAPDINVLLGAALADHPQHAVAFDWLNDAIVACDSGGSIELLPMVAVGFVWLSTDGKIFKKPLSAKEATASIDSLLAIPGVSMPELGREWPALRQLSSAKSFARSSNGFAAT